MRVCRITAASLISEDIDHCYPVVDEIILAMLLDFAAYRRHVNVSKIIYLIFEVRRSVHSPFYS